MSKPAEVTLKLMAKVSISVIFASVTFCSQAGWLFQLTIGPLDHRQSVALHLLDFKYTYGIAGPETFSEGKTLSAVLRLQFAFMFCQI
jgi:hypothetical protein